MNVRNKLALLIALAKRPERRATLDELRDEVADAETDKQISSAEQLYSFDHIDVFGSGVVVSEGDSLLLTENGYSLLTALGIVTREAPDLDPLATVQSLNLIDDLIGPEAHRKIFQSRPEDAGGAHEEASGPATPSDQTAGVEIASREVHPGDGEDTSAPRKADEAPSAPPDFLMHKFGAGARREPERSGFLNTIAMAMKRGGGAWRGHLRQDQPRSAPGRSNAKAERILFAFLGLLVFASGAAATVAYMQAKSAKAELTALQRELLPLRERLARLEQGERSRQALDRPSSLKERLGSGDVAAQAPLVLSREEIQLVRDYIKPAPVIGSSQPPIEVGDLVAGPTLPVPNTVAEKVPKLTGARFTIRNGAIVIVRSGSRHADAVLAQN